MGERATGRDLDVVLYGATGFVGRLTARYLAAHAPDGVRIGLAGRSAERLASLRDELGPVALDWPLLVADAADPGALAEMAATTRVVATSVGPYARYGLPLVEACARAGTDYADVTGEVSFVRESAERCHELATATGARIVHACGFDSVPSDLAVLLAFEQACADGAGELEDTALLVVSMRGGLGGGTIDSARALAQSMRTDPGLRRVLRDPYSLSPDRSAEPDLGEGDGFLPRRDDGVGAWTAPFIMAPFNTRIVRRSNALQGWAYGRRFRYREAMGVGRSPVAPVAAGLVTAGLGAFLAGMALPPTRAVLDRVLPSPGEGPSERTRLRGHFRMHVHAQTSSGARYLVVVAAQGDPGFAATSVMFGESALALALDRDRLPDRAGVLTPAAGIGRTLVERLRAAGFRFSVEPSPT